MVLSSGNARRPPPSVFGASSFDGNLLLLLAFSVVAAVAAADEDEDNGGSLAIVVVGWFGFFCVQHDTRAVPHSSISRTLTYSRIQHHDTVMSQRPSLSR